MIKIFKVIGERCSGTNFLSAAISRNFKISFTRKYGHKHWFRDMDNKDSDKTLFVAIIRDPFTWINSLYRRPTHLPYEMKWQPLKFLSHPISVYNRGKKVNFPSLKYENYKNLFELRKDKNKYLLEEARHRYKNYIIIRYEDLRDDYEQTLNKIGELFDLEKKEEFPVPIPEYKGRKGGREFKINTNTQFNKSELIGGLDIETERRFGYCI